MQLIIGLVVAIILFTLLRQWGSAEPHQRKAWLRNLLIGGLMLVLVLLVVTGRLHVLGAVLAGLLAFIGKLPRLLEWWPWIKRALARLDTGNAADDVSVVETDLLRMVLHRQTGYMEGSVRCGRWQGQALEQLDDESLLALHAEAWRRHLDSLPLLEAYLDRRLGAGWRERTGASEAPVHRDGMSVAEACEVLGVGPDASEEIIIAAHRKLMQKVHPDRGGSNYLAARVNEAKAILLARRGD